jgi:hypothetical protein
MAGYPFCASSADRQLPPRLFCQACDTILPLVTMWFFIKNFEKAAEEKTHFSAKRI